ncbi:MAG: amidohydrolase family protein [Thermosediminibacteraceae bacterium]|nr:amidohydrolase family protein [Thermosediminibacteraceae bacterium]
MNGINLKDWRRTLLEQNYKPISEILDLYKRKNILILRDGGDNLGASLAAREMAIHKGIIYKTPGWAIYKKGRYGGIIGRPVTGIEDFKDVFAELLKVKPDHLKVVLTGLVDFSSYGQVGGVSFSYEELYYIVQTAKEKELPVMVHANSSEAVKMAIEAGADTIEHGYFINDEVLHMLAEKDVIWVPTLSPFGNIIENDELKHKYQSQIQNIKRAYNQQLETVKKAVELGVKIAIGSDAGAIGVYHSQGFFDEVKHIKRCGITENQVLKMAFENGLKALNIKPSELKLLEKSIHQNNKEF